MSSEWPVVAVEDVCELIVDCVNKTAPVVGEPTPYRMIRTTNVRNGRIDLSDCRHVDQETYDKWTRRAKLQSGDVILTREAPIGEVGFVKECEGVFLGQRLMQYRADPKHLDPRFLLYSFLSPALQHQFGSHEGSGSVVSHIRVGDCFKFQLRLPPLAIQKEIATLLGTLDDRIALLHETNATLEAIAQALFKSWFVDFDPVHARAKAALSPCSPPVGERDVPPLPAGEGWGEGEGLPEPLAALFPDSFEESPLGLVPSGWRVGVLGDVAETARKQIQPGAMTADTLYVGLEHIPRKSLGLDTWGTAEELESAKSCFEKGDILFGKLRPYFHKIVIAPFAGVCSTDILVCKAKTSDFYGFVTMHLFSAELVAYANRLSNGAKMPRVNWKDLAGYQVVIPPAELALEYAEVVQPMFDQITDNVLQAQTLATLRDTLLPRLISGALRLPEAEAFVEDAA